MLHSKALGPFRTELRKLYGTITDLKGFPHGYYAQILMGGLLR